MLKKFMETLGIIATILFAIPVPSFANVKINEVAWMGNDKSQYGEWIELYNDGSSLVDLKDSALYEDGGKTLIIKLTKSIDPGGYYLVARSTPSMPDPENGIADDLGSFGGGGLSNSGEYLVLKSARGDILDSLDASTGWPAGDTATKQTMQLSAGKWITATGTPRSINATSITNSGNSENNSTSTGQVSNSSSGTDIGSTANPLDNESGSLSAHSSPVSVGSVAEEMKIVASAGRDRLTLVDTPVMFEAKLYTLKGDVIEGGNISWSFGDGQTATGGKIIHVYKFSGDYAVVMDVERSGEEFVARTNVRVVSGDLDISGAASSSVSIRNRSSYEVNIGGWQLEDGGKSFKFPKDTIVLSKKVITIDKEILGFVFDGEIKLVSPAKNVVSTFTTSKDKNVVVTEPIANIKATTTAEIDGTRSVALVLLGSEQKLLAAKEFLEAHHKAGEVAQSSDLVTSDINRQPVSQKEVIDVIQKPKSFFQYIKSFFF
ncbi:MAG: lamin tail domain-containing protein [Candidatus Vogelbacteria bacterium]|nr:lamin tail domain-containing protein [Candidatus Vogelbacteria bacterium]